MDLAWMAWTWQSGLFWGGLGAVLLIMTLLAVARPETPRVGVLTMATTRGDRLFISLLGSAFICIIWIAISVGLGISDIQLWGAMGLGLLYGIAVFRYV